MKLKLTVAVGIVVALWSGLIIFDWWMRVERFHWQDRLIAGSVASSTIRGPMDALSRLTLPAGAGGDLSRLAAVRDVALRYEEMKPETLVFSDEHGYANHPPTENAFFPSVIVGDSFLQVRYGDQGSFAEQLAAYLDLSVYNHSYAGRGVFWPLLRFVSDGRFNDRMPAVVVWGILEREIGGSSFATFPGRLREAAQPRALKASADTRIDWVELQPRSLRNSLPDTSILAAGARKIWKLASYPLLGEVTTDVVESLPDASGKGYLFYRYSLEPLAWPDEVRDVANAANAVGQIRDFFRERGSALVILLIPEKEQVYRELIPVTPVYQPEHWPESALMTLEEELQAIGVPVVNLLPAFVAAKDQGVPLYWRDDTHWRPEAMRIAAQATAEIIESMAGGDGDG